jgi:hypothetical protein
MKTHELVEAAETNVKEAVRLLAQVVISGCEDSAGLSDHYQGAVRRMLASLLTVEGEFQAWK